MKAIIPGIIVLILIFLISLLFMSLGNSVEKTVVLKGNLAGLPITMVKDRFQCSACGMPVNEFSYSAQVIATDGRTWFFDDIGCMVKWVTASDFEKAPAVWVPDLTTGKWIDGRTAWYSRSNSTPMNYGFGAQSEPDSNYIDFDTLQDLMLNSKSPANPKIYNKSGAD
jgi:hypothetical protein